MDREWAFRILESIEKRAQWGDHNVSMYLMPKKQRDQLVEHMGPGSVGEASAQLANVRGYRALASAARDAIPGTIEGITGLFSDKASDFVKDKFGDPWRRALMSIGGNKVRDFFDNEVNRQKDEIVRRGGSREDSEHADALARGFEGVVKPVAEMAYMWPAWGRAFKGIHAGGKVIGGGMAQVAQKAGVPARVASAAGKTVPYATDAWMFKDIPVGIWNAMPWSATGRRLRRMDDAVKWLDEMSKKVDTSRERLDYGPLSLEERSKRYQEYLDLTQPGWRSKL